MLTKQLPMDQYTLAPFIVIAIIILGNASGLTKITAKYDRQFIDIVSRKRPVPQIAQTPVQNYIQQPIQQPIQTSTNPTIRQHQIPPELLKIMQNPQAPQSGTLTFSTMNSTISEHNIMGVPNQNVPAPVKKPTLAANCPACGQLIPSESNPCPKCGAQLYWD